jgi:hypothetical protein
VTQGLPRQRGVDTPQINAVEGALPALSISEAELVRIYFWSDLPLWRPDESGQREAHFCPAGYYSCGRVIDGDGGEIAWNDVSHLDHDQMCRLMKNEPCRESKSLLSNHIFIDHREGLDRNRFDVLDLRGQS